MALPSSSSPFLLSSAQLRSSMPLCLLPPPHSGRVEVGSCFISAHGSKSSERRSNTRFLGTERGLSRGCDTGAWKTNSVSGSVLQLGICSGAGLCSVKRGSNSYCALYSMDDDSRFPDGLIFEEGIFQDAFGAEEAHSHHQVREDADTEPTGNGLIPEEWKQLQLELHRSKSERKKDIREEELENVKRKEINNRLKREPIQANGNSAVQPLTEGNSLSGFDMNALKHSSVQEVDSDETEQVPANTSSTLLSQRAMPRNPRLSLGEASLQDIDRKLKERTSAQQIQRSSRESIDSELDSFLTAEEKSLLKKRGPDISKVSTEKWMLLHTLAASGQTFLLDEILKQEIDINAVDKDGLTALQKAVICKKEVAVGQLLRAGADANVRDKHGAGLLHYAVQTGSSSLVRLLIRCGIDVNPLDENGWSPLHLAVQSGRADVVKLLLVNGAKNSLNKDGLAPLDVSLAFGRGFNAYAVAKAIKKYSKI